MALVAENRTLLEAFAFTLLENEVLERDDIDRIMSTWRAENGNGKPVQGVVPVPARR
jgi:hypothetical protein